MNEEPAPSPAQAGTLRPIYFLAVGIIALLYINRTDDIELEIPISYVLFFSFFLYLMRKYMTLDVLYILVPVVTSNAVLYLNNSYVYATAAAVATALLSRKFSE